MLLLLKATLPGTLRLVVCCEISLRRHLGHQKSKWYTMHTDKDSASATVCDWSPEPAKLNSTFTRVARRILPSAPASRTFSQDTLRRWERAFREQ